MITPIKAILCTCERCGAQKVYATDSAPVCCWKCKSSYWNQPRRNFRELYDKMSPERKAGVENKLKQTIEQEDDLNSGDYDYMNRD